MQMQDPTQGVPPQLLPHVHLISAQKYPVFQQFSEAQAYQILFEAPKVVKQGAPMQWQYLVPPQDGTVFLTWIGGRMQNQFASDGYVWADPEQRYTQEFGGYTLEIAVHNSGYRPGDQMSTHARRRYRFVSKSPSINALQPDPSLWVVHYSQADQQNFIPVNQVMVSSAIRTQLTERQWIEQQGRLEQQAFMLHDREKWPHLNMPGRAALSGPVYNPGMHAQNPMAHVGNPRFSGQFYQQQQQQQAAAQQAAQAQAQAAQSAVGPSPAKRQRQHPPPQQIPASASALMATDTSIEDEENVLAGDILDHLTQRDISLTRYMQHHEWIEEVFSSPYATSNIIPTDLGFGLMGELAGLTDGILDMPGAVQDPALSKNGSSEAEHKYKKVTPEQLQEFEKRVKAHMAKGQAELERMKQEHAKKMDGFKKGKTLLQAEKRLRNSVWDPADVGNEIWRLDRAAFANTDAGRPKEAADDIIKEVETALGGSIKPLKEANLVQRGGLKDRAPTPPPPTPPAVEEPTNGTAGDLKMQMDGSLDQREAQTQSQGQTAQQPSTVPHQAPSAPPQQQQPTQQQQAQPQQPSNQSFDDDTAMDNSEAMMDDSLMDDLNMDMDVDGTDLNFDDTPKSAVGDAASSSSNPWPQQQQQQQQQPSHPQSHVQQPHTHQQQQSSNTAVPASSSTTVNAPTQQTSANTPDMFAPTTSSSTTAPPPQSNSAVDNTNNAANENASPTFADFDDAGADGLIDFDAGGDGNDDDDLGFGDMDNSAFGDAFHGTEGHGGGEGMSGGDGSGNA